MRRAGGVTGRTGETQSTLASTDAKLLALQAQRMAAQREWEMRQSMMTARLADKDALIASLQQQVAEPPADPRELVDNDGGGYNV